MTASPTPVPTTSKNGRHNECLEAALCYAEAGLAVLPLHTPETDGTCSCGGKCGTDASTGRAKGKHPRTTNGVKDATTSAAQIRRWWSQWPDANVGVACGDASRGLVALDFDDPTLYPLYRDKIINSTNAAVSGFPQLINTLAVQRTGRGLQVFFFTPKPSRNETLAKQVDGKKAIETRETGGYVMVAPSRHPNGQTYHFVQSTLTMAPNLSQDIADHLKSLAMSFDAPPPNPLANLVVPASAVAGRKPAAVSWITEKFIESGELVLITAPGGSMKSLLMLYWACCVAAGLNFLAMPNRTGGRRTKTSGVLWVNTDNGQSTHEGRLLAILRALNLSDIPLSSITTTDFELANPAHVTNLHLLADDVAADVIVIDTLSGCLTGVNENSAEEMTLPAAHLRSLASAGRTVMGIHHPPKADSDGSRGSSVLPNKVDRVFSIARDHNILTIKPQKVRNSPSPAISAIAALDVDVGNDALLGVAFFDGGAAQAMAELETTKSAVLDVLMPGPLNTRALYKAVKARKAVVKTAVDALVLTRQVSKTEGKSAELVYKRVL